MADGLLDMIIQSADFEKLNVKPGDVLKGKLYVGPDGQVHAGEMEDRRSPTLYIDLNGRLTLRPENMMAEKYDKVSRRWKKHILPLAVSRLPYTQTACI